MKFFHTEVNFLLLINDQWEPKKQLRHHLPCKTQSSPPPLLHEKETKTKPGHLDRFSYEIAKLALQKETETLQIQRMDIQLAKLKSQGDNAKCFCNTTSQIGKIFSEILGSSIDIGSSRVASDICSRVRWAKLFHQLSRTEFSTWYAVILKNRDYASYGTLRILQMVNGACFSLRRGENYQTGPCNSWLLKNKEHSHSATIASKDSTNPLSRRHWPYPSQLSPGTNHWLMVMIRRLPSSPYLCGFWNASL